MKGKSFGWLEVELIGQLLAEQHPAVDPYRVGFPQLRTMVQALDGFQEEAGHPCNEKILETIQKHWIEERAGLREDEDQ